MITREMLAAIVTAIVTIVIALVPELKPLAPTLIAALVAILGLVLGIPAAKETLIAMSANRVEALRLELAIAEQRVKG